MAKWGPIMPEWRPIENAPEGEELLLGCWVETGTGPVWAWWRSSQSWGDGEPTTGTPPTHFLTPRDLPTPPGSATATIS